MDEETKTEVVESGLEIAIKPKRPPRKKKPFDLPRIIRLYRITCKANGKRYVGQTVQSLQYRWTQHCYGDGCKRMHAAIKEHGKDNFVIEEVGSATDQMLADWLEQALIERWDTRNPDKGYNIAMGGYAAGMTGRTHTKEARAKISKALTGKTVSDETRAHLSAINMGKTLSQSQIEAIRRAHTGKVVSEETREKLSAALVGKWAWNKGQAGLYSHTDETKKKLSEAGKGREPPNKGKQASPELRAKLSEAHKGKRPSEEAIAKGLATKARNRFWRLANEWFVSPPKQEEPKPKIKAPRSEEWKRKLSESNKGKAISEETRAKLSSALQGREVWNTGKSGVFHHSDETRAKMSQSHANKSEASDAKRKEAARTATKGRTWKMIDGKRVWLDKPSEPITPPDHI